MRPWSFPCSMPVPGHVGSLVHCSCRLAGRAQGACAGHVPDGLWFGKARSDCRCTCRGAVHVHLTSSHAGSLKTPEQETSSTLPLQWQDGVPGLCVSGSLARPGLLQPALLCRSGQCIGKNEGLRVCFGTSCKGRGIRTCFQGQISIGMGAVHKAFVLLPRARIR